MSADHSCIPGITKWIYAPKDSVEPVNKFKNNHYFLQFPLLPLVEIANITIHKWMKKEKEERTDKQWMSEWMKERMHRKRNGWENNEQKSMKEQTKKVWTNEQTKNRQNPQTNGKHNELKIKKRQKQMMK